LVELKSKAFEIVSWQNFKFCSTAIVTNVGDKVTWRFIVVYGCRYEDHKMEFLTELDPIMQKWQGPTLLGEGGGAFQLSQEPKGEK
jgi:hypothetical protein